MRKFIISDIHGFGNVYYSIMKYLDNISETEEIELYINGDLIDRGHESGEILLDVKRRIEENKYKIVYLGGNHELMMHNVLDKRKKGLFVSPQDDWYYNGGRMTEFGLEDYLNQDKNKIFELDDFISNLKIYHLFRETVKGKRILLVHAAAPAKVKEECNLKIKNNNDKVHYSVWTKENDIYAFLGFPYQNPSQNRIGHKDYFTIIGHTPCSNPLGYDYYKHGNYLNIDGGCAGYLCGEFNYDHFPLVEVCPGFLKILTFNSNNEIVCGNYFDGERSFSYSTLDMEKARSYLNNDVKIKKLSKNEDGIVY